MENKKLPQAADSPLHRSFQVSDALVVQVDQICSYWKFAGNFFFRETPYIRIVQFVKNIHVRNTNVNLHGKIYDFEF